MTDMKSKTPRLPRGAHAPADAAPGEDGKERVAKVMARAGLCSRRDAEAWIKAGRVAVNGTLIVSPALNIAPDDRIAVDGQPIDAREHTRLFLYHKPRGLVTTAKDPEGRPTVFDNLPEGLPRVVSIGRLDINTEGLLLLTNDGGLARTLELPSTGWLRRYRVRANGVITQDKLDALKDGITIEGMDYAGIEATLDRAQGANVWLSMGLREGKNREIKRVLEHLGLYVNRLIRLSFGPFQLGEIAEGAAEEVRTRVLKEQLGPALASEAGATWEDAITAEVVTRALHHAEKEPVGERPGPRDRPRSGRGDAREEPRPRIDRPQPSARPHVSALRAERPKTGEEPRKRITRASTADRKGRRVAVERVTVEDKGRHTGGGGTTRNARNFARARRDAMAPEGEAPREARPSRGGSRGETRGGFGSDRPQTGRALKEAKTRPACRRDDDARPPRESGDRPARTRTPRSDGDRPNRAGAPRGDGRPSRSGAPGGGKPRADGPTRGGPARGGRPPRDGGGSGGQGGHRPRTRG